MNNTGKYSNCIYCGNSESEFCFFTVSQHDFKYAIRFCNKCNAYFLDPRPDSEALEKAYDSTYYGELDNKFGNGIVEKAVDFFRKYRARRISKMLINGSRILDIGCGNGRFLLFMRKFGNYDIYGIEPGEGSANRARRIDGINLNNGFLKDNLYPDVFFDAITLFHVFEHLDNPSETLDIICKILKPGGLLVVSFPNISSLQARLFKGKWLHLDPPRHLFFFAPDVFAEIMHRKGFITVKKRFISLEQNPFGAIQSILNLITPKRDLLYESFKGNKKFLGKYPAVFVLFQKVFFLFSFPLFIITDCVASLFNAGATVEFTFKYRK